MCGTPRHLADCRTDFAPIKLSGIAREVGSLVDSQIINHDCASQATPRAETCDGAGSASSQASTVKSFWGLWNKKQTMVLQHADDSAWPNL
jgi:hypothetical protein